MNKFFSPILLASVLSVGAADHKIPNFRTVEIDAQLEIGYGVALADMDGDGKPDIVLADKNQFAWYQNPSWEKHIMVENLTERDHVCIDARDIDGDGKAEVAVGAQWNPNETSDEAKSGSVHYLIPPEDRTQKWTPVQLPHEPTIHRMRWIKTSSGDFALVVLPLHGRDNKGGEGAGVKTIAYKVPANPQDTWETTVIDDQMHKTHNLEIATNLPQARGQEALLIAGAEGVFLFRPENGSLNRRQIIGSEEGASGFVGAGEVRSGNLPGGGMFITTVEPMHGNQLVSYTPPARNSGKRLGIRNVLFDEMVEGHALACGDILGIGSDQVVVGWRGNRTSPNSFGLKLFIPSDSNGQAWTSSDIDVDGMACEDVKLGDLNGDGRLDIVACGRSTKNLRIYFNEGL
ncbi:MAG: VCBS repeat-containing protein [Verrucomicrobia bacterium]|nr:VCBS repeat-containing protein [Verrucomicrobiota bacterium]MDA1068857.1 VCBS repeat-containing protein [Verrucomicrobiota bacterium]